MSLSLKRITLNNFRGIRGSLDWEFHQQPGFYFIAGKNLKEPLLGANGAGKSTIFVDGPYWILTGKTILSQRPGNSIENWDLDKGSTWGELQLTVDDQLYIIVRGRNPSVLTINRRTVEQSEIDKLIPLSDSAMRRTLLLGQRSQMFLDLRAEEKSRLFSETLDLDVWLRASDRASVRLKDKELELTKIQHLASGLDGSMNEIRDQHETAIEKESLFMEAQAVRLHELQELAAKEATVHDALKSSLLDAQTRLAEISEGSTLDDEQRTLRARERTAGNLIASVNVELRQITRRDDELEKMIVAYNDSKVCPECGQTVTDEHAHTRKTELLTEQETIRRRILEIPHVLALQDKIIRKTEKTLIELEEVNKKFIETRGNIKILEQQVLMQERVFIRAMQDIRKHEKEENPFTALCDQLETRFAEQMGQREKLRLDSIEVERDIAVLKFWQKGYRDIRLEQIDTTLLELELATNRNATALGLENWEIQFATERENKSGTVSHVFSIFLYPPGQNQPIPWESYSGGEAQRWQLATTLGLSEVLLSRAGITPDFEIFDEPTTFLSQEGIDSLLEMLHTRAHELQRRIYLIDHRSLERGSFDGVVTVVKDKAGVRIET